MYIDLLELRGSLFLHESPLTVPPNSFVSLNSAQMNALWDWGNCSLNLRTPKRVIFEFGEHQLENKTRFDVIWSRALHWSCLIWRVPVL